MAAQLLDVFGFVSVLLRGGALALNCLVLGGVAFLTFVRPTDAAMAAARRLIFYSAASLAVVQICYVGADSMVLAQTAGLRLGELAGANFFLAGSAAICAATVLAVLTWRAPALPQSRLLIPAVIAWAALLMTSHAAGRLDHRLGRVFLTVLHQGATATWIGGLPYLLLTIGRCGKDSRAGRLCGRFSRLAAISVALLAGSGILMSRLYVGSVAAVYGTSYGRDDSGKSDASGHAVMPRWTQPPDRAAEGGSRGAVTGQPPPIRGGGGRNRVHSHLGGCLLNFSAAGSRPAGGSRHCR